MNLRHCYEKDFFSCYSWAVIIVIALIYATLILAQSYWLKANSFSLSQDALLISQFKQSQLEADISIVMLGNSRLRHAVTFGFYPEKLIDLADGKKLAAVQYGIDVGSYHWFSHLVEDILEARPDYLLLVRNIITNNTFVATSSEGASHAIIYATARTVFNYLNRAVRYRLPPESNWMYDRRGVDSTCFEDFTFSRLLQRIEMGAGRDKHTLDGDETVSMRAFIRRALDKGITVIIVDLPPNMEKVTEFGKPRHVLDYPALGYYPERQQILPGMYTQVLWPDHNVDAVTSNYCDYTHLNKAGRKIFSTWLLEELVEYTK